MLAWLKQWITPPVFPNDEDKTRRASLLNIGQIIAIVFAMGSFVGNLAGGRTPPIITASNLGFLILVLFLRYWMYQGKITLSSVLMMTLAFVYITGTSIALGTIRTPTTAIYGLIVLLSGVFFGTVGMIVSIVASALAVLGLVLAENARWLPTPDYTVTITQWIMYVILFSAMGGLMHWAIQSHRHALERADHELGERKHAEQALQQTTQELDRFFNINLDLLCIADTDGYFRKVNLAWEKTLGYTLEELVGKQFLDFVHPDDLANTLEAISALASQQQVIGFLNRYRHKDGTYRWIEWRSAPYGNIIYAAAHDITDQKIDEDKLKQAETQFHTLVEQLPAFVYQAEFGRDGEWLYISPRIEQLLGFTPEEWKRDRELWFNQLHPDDIQIALSAGARSQRTGMPFQVEYRMFARDGHLVWIRDEAIVLQGIPGRPPYLQGFMTDITERKISEQALRESEAKFRSFVEQSAEGFTLVDEQGTIVGWNNAREKMTGWTRDQVIGQKFWDIQHKMLPTIDQTPELYARRKQVIQDALQTGESPIFSRVIQAHTEKPNGEQRFFEQSVFPIKTERGYWLGSVTRDVTERKLMEDRLRASELIYHSLVEAMPINVCCKDLQGRFTFANTLYAKGFNKSPEEIIGKTDLDLHPLEAAQKYRQDDQRVIDSGQAIDQIEEHVLLDGETTFVQVIKTPLRDTNGKITGIQILFWDVTARYRSEEQLRYLSTHDALTGLYNRAFFESESTRIENSREFPISIVIADFDNMKATNDTLGHASGDELLKRGANVFRASFRASDIIARIGGDEFAVLLPETDATDLVEILARVQNNLAQANTAPDAQPLLLSFGAATAQHQGVMEAFKQADTQMYANKRKNKLARGDKG